MNRIAISPLQRVVKQCFDGKLQELALRQAAHAIVEIPASPHQHVKVDGIAVVHQRVSLVLITIQGKQKLPANCSCDRKPEAAQQDTRQRNFHPTSHNAAERPGHAGTGLTMSLLVSTESKSGLSGRAETVSGVPSSVGSMEIVVGSFMRL